MDHQEPQLKPEVISSPTEASRLFQNNWKMKIAAELGAGATGVGLGAAVMKSGIESNNKWLTITGGIVSGLSTAVSGARARFLHRPLSISKPKTA